MSTEDEFHPKESSIGRTVDEANKDLAESLHKIQAGQKLYDLDLTTTAQPKERLVEPSVPKYQFQHLGGIVVQEVMPDDPDYPTARSLMLDPIRDGRDIFELQLSDYPAEEIALAREEFEEHVLAALEKQNWWLQPEWQERLSNGELTEQIEFRIGDRVVNLFNFNEALDSSTLATLQQTLTKIASINGGELLDGLDSIIFESRAGQKNDNKHVTVKNGTVLATANGKLSLITVYTGGQELLPLQKLVTAVPENNPITGVDLRVPDVPLLAWVIAHELGHLNHSSLERVQSDKADNWHTITGRSNMRLPRSWQLVGALDQSGATRDYALTNESEDFAESFALAILAPQLLDDKRKDYFRDLVLQPNPLHVEVSIRTGRDIQLPRVPDVIKYKIEPYEPLF